MKKRFVLTYDTVTEESASYGDHATHGFVTRNLTIPSRTNMPKNPARFTLKEALAFVKSMEAIDKLTLALFPSSAPRVGLISSMRKTLGTLKEMEKPSPSQSPCIFPTKPPQRAQCALHESSGLMG